jgi:hypothetical protein
MPKHNAPKINWTNINARITGIVEKITEQNFCIDVAHRILLELRRGLAWRNDLNLPVISSYWSRETMEHFKLNDYKPLLEREVFIDANYYSYLNLTETNKNNASSGETTYVVDLISDTTDTKRGDDLDTWMVINQDFQDNLKDLWMKDVLSYWIKEDKLVTRKKKVIKLEEYWNYEDYIYMIRVWDPELNIKIIFIVGTYDKYV